MSSLVRVPYRTLCLMSHSIPRAHVACEWWNRLAPYQSEYAEVRAYWNSEDDTISVQLVFSPTDEELIPVYEFPMEEEPLVVEPAVVEVPRHETTRKEAMAAFSTAIVVSDRGDSEKAKACLVVAAECLSSNSWDSAREWSLESISYSIGFDVAQSFKGATMNSEEKQSEPTTVKNITTPTPHVRRVGKLLYKEQRLLCGTFAQTHYILRRTNTT